MDLSALKTVGFIHFPHDSHFKPYYRYRQSRNALLPDRQIHRRFSLNLKPQAYHAHSFDSVRKPSCIYNWTAQNNPQNAHHRFSIPIQFEDISMTLNLVWNLLTKVNEKSILLLYEYYFWQFSQAHTALPATCSPTVFPTPIFSQIRR